MRLRAAHLAIVGTLIAATTGIGFLIGRSVILTPAATAPVWTFFDSSSQQGSQPNASPNQLTSEEIPAATSSVPATPSVTAGPPPTLTPKAPAMAMAPQAVADNGNTSQQSQAPVSSPAQAIAAAMSNTWTSSTSTGKPQPSAEPQVVSASAVPARLQGAVPAQPATSSPPDVTSQGVGSPQGGEAGQPATSSKPDVTSHAVQEATTSEAVADSSTDWQPSVEHPAGIQSSGPPPTQSSSNNPLPLSNASSGGAVRAATASSLVQTGTSGSTGENATGVNGTGGQQVDTLPLVRYHVQIGAFISRQDAEGQAGRAQALGYAVTVVEQDTLYHVRVGGFLDQAAARELARNLTRDGFTVLLTP
jgi:SPOR domain